MKKVVLAATLVAAAPFATAAERSYTYIEAGYVQVRYNAWAGEPEGGYFRGSFDLGKGIHLLARHSRVSDSLMVGAFSSPFGSSPGWRYDYAERYSELGLGYHAPLSDRVDVIAELVGARLDSESETSDFSLDGARASLGLRASLTDALEGTVRINRYDGGSYGYFDGDTSGTLGVQYRITPTWGITAEVEHGGFVFDEDQTQSMLGVRASF